MKTLYERVCEAVHRERAVEADQNREQRARYRAWLVDCEGQGYLLRLAGKRPPMRFEFEHRAEYQAACRGYRDADGHLRGCRVRWVG